MKKYSQLHESFYHEIFILEQNSKIMKVFCHESVELYGITTYITPLSLIRGS